jgi:DNA-binding XRE family transcriptional regulator
MIRNSVVQEVKRLLFVEGLSQRSVALRAGVSRGTVHAIARGKRTQRVHTFTDDELPWHDAPPRRCPECGGLVYMPCLLCQVRALRPVRRVG